MTIMWLVRQVNKSEQGSRHMTGRHTNWSFTNSAGARRRQAAHCVVHESISPLIQQSIQNPCLLRSGPLALFTLVRLRCLIG